MATAFWLEPSDQLTFQGPVPVKAAEMLVELPLQTVAVPLATEVGRAFTVTTALPVRSPTWAVQFASVRLVTVYVVVADGLTLRVAGLAATAFWLEPSDQLTFHGPVPVKAAEMVAELPLQIVAVPLATEVGRASTVTTALPVRSPAWAVQLASVRLVTV